MKNFRFLSVLSLIVMLALHSSAVAAVTDRPPAAQRSRPAPARHKASPLDQRVALLTRQLGLDAQQQLALRKVLEGQRAEVLRIWDDQSLSSASRIGATQAVTDRTADNIRALLTDEQKKKFRPPRPVRDPAAGSRANVSEWMNKARPQ